MRQPQKLIASVVAAALLLAGCSRATAENFEKIQVGMKKTEVHQLIGKPSKTEGADVGPASLYHQTWNNGAIVITITFEGDTVAMKTIHGDQVQP